jgi:methylenetetrahydrofolate reductase (NADPH)
VADARQGPIVQFEVLPFERAEEEAARLPEPARLTVTSSPRHGPDHTVEFAVRLAELGHTVTPHLAARMIRDQSHLDDLLARVAAAGIEDLFVIGGDNHEPVGAYSSAGELLPLIRERAAGVRTIGIAAYPEGHPQIKPDTLARVLEEKSRIADYMTTQMCFESDVLLEWLRESRAGGISLPVNIGLPGAVDRKRLLEVSMRIGVGPSVAYVRKQRGIRALLRRPSSAADKLLDALAPCLEEPELNVTGFHYYTLNALIDTWTWERDKHIPGKEVKNELSQP